MARNQKCEKKAILDALADMPIVEAACNKAGVPRSTYYRWTKDEETFHKEAQEAIKIGDQRVNGIAESKLIHLVQQGDLPSVRFWLNNRSVRYGYPKNTPEAPDEDYRPIRFFDMRLFNKDKRKPKS